ncbi:hypothetical protein Q5H80_20235 [Vibrio sp. SNU_ST1]|uniref:hypothetical protein n=1 Tax=Vibrio sp. SNU_ST1 TaxID=3064001 RepID=UPI00272BC487|nr:hypothetical protein [Vibrio sp. SNU_ST1]WKY59885.1 hypothetical protein Q5H80_20235 [Vibrio sp. SNU_ST1]
MKNINILLAALFISCSTYAAEFNHNGVLYDANSQTTIDATLPVVFSIYKSDGQLLWKNEKTIQFIDGNYSVTLGEDLSIDASIFANADLYLGINIDNDGEMSPKLKLYTTPRSYHAEMASSVVGIANLSELKINGDIVIDQDGKWVGDIAGLKGETGAQGIQGEAGPQGDSGIEQGSKGETGSQGPKGDTGLQGLQGATGAQGPKGDTGLQGLQGATGAQGPKGDTGLQGLQGATGAQGPKGDTGPQGLKGDDAAALVNYFTQSELDSVDKDATPDGTLVFNAGISALQLLISTNEQSIGTSNSGNMSASNSINFAQTFTLDKNTTLSAIKLMASSASAINISIAPTGDLAAIESLASNVNINGGWNEISLTTKNLTSGTEYLLLFENCSCTYDSNNNYSMGEIIDNPTDGSINDPGSNNYDYTFTLVFQETAKVWRTIN